METTVDRSTEAPWTKGKLVGQKAPFKLKEIWAIRIRLQLAHRTRELALFDLGLDSKLRAYDLVKLRVRDVSHGDRMATRAIIPQQKTSKPVPQWIKEVTLRSDDFLFPRTTTSAAARPRCSPRSTCWTARSSPSASSAIATPSG